MTNSRAAEREHLPPHTPLQQEVVALLCFKEAMDHLSPLVSEGEKSCSKWSLSTFYIKSRSGLLQDDCAHIQTTWGVTEEFDEHEN